MVGHVALGYRGGVAGSVRQQVHDGDTISVLADGNFGIRFLGVDAPEISFRLPGEERFTSLGNERWEEFLSDPFAAEMSPFDPSLDEGLRNFLQARIGPGTAVNHRHHAEAAEDALENEVLNDMQALGQNEESFRFFLVFAGEVMDLYGRFLCFINRDQAHPMNPAPRPRSYNERLLEAAKVSPYFIWPNINPFRRQGSVSAAVIPPNTANDIANAENTLRLARLWVQNGRQQQFGIFEVNNPLRLEPFEVRFLARRNPPKRWVIDLSKNDDILLKPQAYHTIPHSEDRLFIPEEYVPLFVEAGWQRQA